MVEAKTTRLWTGVRRKNDGLSALNFSFSKFTTKIWASESYYYHNGSRFNDENAKTIFQNYRFTDSKSTEISFIDVKYEL